jgi:aldoxime dehydratase
MISPKSQQRSKPMPPSAQRWSATFPPKTNNYYVAFYGVQIGPTTLKRKGHGILNEKEMDEHIKKLAPYAKILDESAFFKWYELASTSPFSPGAFDHSRFIDGQGYLNHVYATYWTDEERFQSWREARSYHDFWDVAERVTDNVGCWREEMRVPIERQESVYFSDFIAGIARCESVKMEKSEHSGYYGSMRERIPYAKIDGPDEPLTKPIIRDTAHARLQVHTPEYLTIIRSGQYWARCQEEQRADYFARLQPALENGMNYLRDHPVETGCCSLRYMRNYDLGGKNLDETSAIGFFLSIHHMESWAKDHASHEKIYTIAKQQLKDKTFKRELRTWHEVYVLPHTGHLFEYTNCQPMTGLLPYFEVTRKG